MTPEQFRRLKQLYQELHSLPQQEWQAFVGRACGDDPELRRELAALIAHQDRETRLDELEGAVQMLQAGLGEAEVGADVEPTAPLSNLSLLGERLGNIRIDARIGQGGMGEVYRGWDEALERQVAIKTIRPEYTLSREARGRFLREARLLSKLDHPNICRVFELVERPEGDCLILEYLDGRTLREVPTGELEERQRIAIAVAITEALVAAHGEKIVHRDLKPENVMLLGDGRVKVLDFGIARSVAATSALPVAATTEQLGDLTNRSFDGDPTVQLESGSSGERTTLTRKGTTPGTLRYMSPEQARGERVTRASDMFALGLMLQELWTGKSAYSAKTAEALFRRVVAGEPQAAPGIAPEIARLIQALESSAPADRPTAAETLAVLERYRTEPQRRRRRVLGAAAALLVVLLITAALWLGGRFRQAPLLMEPEQRGRVLVLPIANQTGDDGYDWVERGLWAMVLQTLEDVKGIEAISTASVDRLIDEELGGRLASLSRSELSALHGTVGAELVLQPILRRRGEVLRLDATAVNVNGSTSSWTLEGNEATALARDLGADIIRRLEPDAEFQDVFDRFSHDPFVNRLYATGVDELRTDGARQALHYFETALDLDPELEWARISLANVRLQLTDFDRAESLANQVLSRAEEQQDPKLQASALSVLSTLAYQRGNLELAEEHARSLLALSRDHGDREQEAYSLMRLGDVDRVAGRYAGAAGHYGEALTLRRELEDLYGEAHSLHTLGVLASEEGDVDAAERLLHQALALEEEQGFRHLSGMTHNGLGILETQLGNGERARDHFEKALERYEQVGARQQAIHVLINIGASWDREGDLERALEANSRALELAQGIESTTTWGALAFNRAYNLVELGTELDEAEKYLEMAAEVYGEEDPDILVVSSLLYARRGETAKALRTARRAKELAGAAWDDEREAMLQDLLRAAEEG